MKRNILLMIIIIVVTVIMWIVIIRKNRDFIYQLQFIGKYF